MSGRMLWTAVVVAALSSGLAADPQGPPAGGAAPPAGGTPTRSGGIIVPTIALQPGLNPVPNYAIVAPELPPPVVPDGFTAIFNGRDLSGWHVSKTARHGYTPDFRVQHGVILGTQQPYGQGGILLTDRNYRDFDLTLEVKPDWGCDSGIFFRTTENGTAYQITMDYLGNGVGSLGRLIGEGGVSMGGGRGGRGAAAPAAAVVAPAARGTGGGALVDVATVWKREEWNLVRVRVQGDAPHVQVWINGQMVTDQQDTANHAPLGMVEGPIALQVHGGTDRWAHGGFWRWRNIGIREMPR